MNIASRLEDTSKRNNINNSKDKIIVEDSIPTANDEIIEHTNLLPTSNDKIIEKIIIDEAVEDVSMETAIKESLPYRKKEKSQTQLSLF